MGFRKNRPVHIMIKDYVIRYVELKQTNPLVVQHFRERYLPNGIIKEGKIIDRESLSLILEECIDDWKIRKRKVFFHVPDALVVIRKITIPDDVRDDEIYGYLYMEIGTSIHLPFEEPVFDFSIIPSPQGKKEIILFAAPENMIEAYSNLLDESKLTPTVADISSLSLYRLYHQLVNANHSGQLMVVQFDVQSVNVCIFENQYPVFMRHIAMEVNLEKWDYSLFEGETDIISYEGNEQEILFALEDMYTEIARVIDFYRYTLNHGNQQVTKLFLTGDHPWMADIQKEMRRRMPVPIETIDRDLIRTASNNAPLPTAFHCAVGLALKGV